MKHARSKKSGYTLVELLVYVTILAFMIAVLVAGLVIVVQSFTRVRVSRSLVDTGGVAMERITREIRQATSVDDPNSLFNQNPGYIKLNTLDQASSPTTIEFALSGSNLTVKVGSGTTDNLIIGDTQVSSLIFRKLATTTATGIKVELTLVDSRLPASPVNFYTTAILRGSY